MNQIRSVAQSCPTLCDPMNRSTPGLPVRHQLLASEPSRLLESRLTDSLAIFVCSTVLKNLLGLPLVYCKDSELF